MKKVTLIALAVVFSLSGFSQAREQTRSEKKKERKAKEWLKEKEELLDLAHDSTFVLDARTHLDRYQNLRQLTDNNFISVVGDEIIIQTSNPYGVGYNGLGGITLQGIIQNYEIKEGKRKHGPSIRINFTNSAIGHGTLFINLNGKDNVTARLTDNWGNRNTWQGRVLEPENIRNFTGMSFR